MGVKFRIENLSEIEKDYLLRCSGKTIISGIEIKSELEKLSKKYKFQPLRTKFTILSGYAFRSEDFSSDNSLVPVIRIGDIGKDNYLSDCVFIGEEFLQSQKDFILKQDDILVGLTGDGKLKCSINEGDNPKLLNQRVGALRPKEQNTNIQFYYYLLNSSIVKKQFLWYSNGKTQLNISPFDFLKIKVPEISKERQYEVVKKIEPIEEKIKSLKVAIKPIQDVINKVFAREFGFSENLYQEFGKGMTASSQWASQKKLRTFVVNVENLSMNKRIRCGTRYHNPPTVKLINILKNIDTIKVKDILKEPIRRGVSPEYDNDGEILVIKTAHLKNQYVDFLGEEHTNREFFLSSKRGIIKKGDILLASTGKPSIGKIDLIEDDVEAITDSHISIIRIQNYNPLFFVYYFRSILGYFQIERDFTGCTNQIELYTEDIQDFLIPDISLEKQEKIVEEIQTEINEQDKIKKEIQQERYKIDEIIESAIR